MILQEAEMVGDMKFFVPFEEAVGDRAFAGFKIWSFPFSLSSRSRKGPTLSLQATEFLLGKSAEYQNDKPNNKNLPTDFQIWKVMN